MGHASNIEEGMSTTLFISLLQPILSSIESTTESSSVKVIDHCTNYYKQIVHLNIWFLLYPDIHGRINTQEIDYHGSAQETSPTCCYSNARNFRTQSIVD